MAESKEELKSLLMRVKEESERVILKLNIKKTKVMAFTPITSWQIEREKVEEVTDFLSWALKSLWMKSEENFFLAGKRWQPRHCVEKQRHYSADKGPYHQGNGLLSGLVWLWELDHKEVWMQEKLCFWTVMPGETKRQRSLACCSPWGGQFRCNLATEQQQQYMYQQSEIRGH